MKKIIRKILKEDRRQKHLDNIIRLMKNDFPLFKNLRKYGLYQQLSKDELIYTFSNIFGQPITLMGRTLMDENRKVLYYEDYDGVWEKREYDERGKLIYKENSDGFWYKREYDKYGYISYEENSRGEISDNR